MQIFQMEIARKQFGMHAKGSVSFFGAHDARKHAFIASRRCCCCFATPNKDLSTTQGFGGCPGREQGGEHKDGSYKSYLSSPPRQRKWHARGSEGFVVRNGFDVGDVVCGSANIEVTAMMMRTPPFWRTQSGAAANEG